MSDRKALARSQRAVQRAQRRADRANRALSTILARTDQAVDREIARIERALSDAVADAIRPTYAFVELDFRGRYLTFGVRDRKPFVTRAPWTGAS